MPFPRELQNASEDCAAAMINAMQLVSEAEHYPGLDQVINHILLKAHEIVSKMGTQDINKSEKAASTLKRASKQATAYYVDGATTLDELSTPLMTYSLLQERLQAMRETN